MFDLPDDALGQVLGFLRRAELLSLRAAASSGQEAVRRGVMNQSCGPRRLYPSTTKTDSAKHIGALGRVFGPGCTMVQGTINAMGVSPMRDFIRSTGGCLIHLSLYKVGAIDVMADDLVDLCRFAPQLVSLMATSVDVKESHAIAISAACPGLRRVDLDPPAPYSFAETYAHRFPNLEHLSLSGNSVDTYWRPTQLSNIALALNNCRSLKAMHLRRCNLCADLVDMLVGSPLGDRLRTLFLYSSAVDEPATILKCARLPQLDTIILPRVTRLNVRFYEALAQAAPGVTHLSINDTTTENDSILAACAASLKVLDLDGLEFITPSVIPGIISSNTAASLKHLIITDCDDILNLEIFTAGDVLLLARNCPLLTILHWTTTVESDDGPWLDPRDAAELTQLLHSRGSRLGIFPRDDGGSEHPGVFYDCDLGSLALYD